MKLAETWHEEMLRNETNGMLIRSPIAVIRAIQADAQHYERALIFEYLVKRGFPHLVNAIEHYRGAVVSPKGDDDANH